MSFQTDFIRLTISRLEAGKKSAEAAMKQVSPEKLFTVPAPGSNSIAIIVQHMSGNMISRWTDFLVSDGEKSWRNRDLEFESQVQDPKTLMEKWEEGWVCFLKALHELTADDLDNTITIRGESHFVYDALLRQIMHYSHHMGQLVYLSKWWAGDRWLTLSIPKGESETYNRHLNESKK